jgi:hypothetical protein
MAPRNNGVAALRLLYGGVDSDGRVAERGRSENGSNAVYRCVYWIPLYDILEEHGIAEYLVNARDTKNLPGHREPSRELASRTLIFQVKQELARYDFCQLQIAECDRELEQHLLSLPELRAGEEKSGTKGIQWPPKKRKRRKRPQHPSV